MSISKSHIALLEFEVKLTENILTDLKIGHILVIFLYDYRIIDVLHLHVDRNQINYNLREHDL